MADLSASVWEEYAKAYGGDKEKAKQVLLESQKEEEQRVKERKVRDLQNEFPLPREVIESVLGDVNWDPELAIIPLWEMVEKQRQEARKKEQQEQEKRLEQERQARRREAEVKAKEALGQLFRDVPEAKIQQVLDENEGDVDATVDQLLHMIRQEEESRQQAEARRKQEDEEILRRQEAERQLKIDTVKQRFGDYLVDEEIVEALQRHDWQIRQASNDLLKLVEERKLAQLKRLYGDLTVDEIQSALQANDWKLVDTMKQLAALQESKKKAKEQPQVKSQTPPEPVSRPEETFLLRSALIGEEMEKIVLIQKAQAEKVEQETDPYRIVKERFQQKIIRPDNLPGLPGMIPLTPKLIDELHGKERPVAEQSTSSQPTPDERKPSPISASTVLTEHPSDNMRVTLKATPSRADIGQEIKVEWNSEDPTSTSDWIGVYKAGSTAAASSYVTWNWIGEAKQQGTLSFVLSEFGDFEFRYFSKRQYHVRATSNPVHIGPAVDLTARFDADSNSIFVKIEQRSGNVYPNAWVGMYASADADNSSYRGYDWASNARDHELRFAAPKAGAWHFRYFPQKSYVDVARCSTNVSGNDRLELSISDGQMIVRTHIVTVEPGNDSAWIGIYRVEQTDPRLYRKYKYVPVGASNGVITFRSCTTPGEYEARLFANKTLDVVCRSNTARVGPSPATSSPSTSS